MDPSARALAAVAAFFVASLSANAAAQAPAAEGEASSAPPPPSGAAATPELELGAARLAFRSTPDAMNAERVARAAERAALHREAAEHYALAISLTPQAASEDRARLQAELKRAKAHVATLVVKLSPEVAATIVVDGTPLGSYPLKLPLYLDPGEHDVAALADDRRFVSVKVGLMADKSFTITLREAPAGATDGSVTRPVWPAIVMGSLGAAALVTGVATLVISFAREDDAESLAGAIGACDTTALDDDCLRLAAFVSDRNSLRNASTIAFVASGVLAGATLGYLFIPLPSDDGPPKAALRLKATATLDHAGLSLEGTFQ